MTTRRRDSCSTASPGPCRRPRRSRSCSRPGRPGSTWSWNSLWMTQFRFQTQITNPGIFTGFVGNLAGIPPITALSGDGAQGLGLQQTYSINMVTSSGSMPISDDQVLHAVPSNVGPRTMPNYASLVQQGIYTLDNGIRVFAGTVADPFFIDLGGVFDSLNLRASVAPVLSAAVDGDDHNNYAPNALSGYNVNSIDRKSTRLN